MAEQLFNELTALPEVNAIALGGSRSGDACDAQSDYDVYLYTTGSIAEEKRLEILSKSGKERIHHLYAA